MPAIGDTIGRYVIEAILGEGGMGRVYRALDPSLGRRVALKVLIADGKDEAARVEAATRMMREARAVAAFMHPNVVAIHDVGQVDGAPFIAMELVSGATLRAVVGAPGIAGAQKLAWLVEVARGLGAAHRAGLVHRDIKPENVMVTNDGVVKVLDFGIARRAATGGVDGAAPTHEVHLASVTAEGLAIGTPQYMSPEQLQAMPLDGRCDQYAWGVLAYELFAGKLPWGSKDGAQLVAAVLAGPVMALKEVVPSIDPRVSEVVARAMKRDREARFASMTELLAALPPADSRPGSAAAIVIRSADTADTSAATTAGPVASTRPVAPERAAWWSRRRGLLVATAAVAVAGLIVGQRILAARRLVEQRAASHDVPILGPLPASLNPYGATTPWTPPADGELHAWSSGREHGAVRSDVRHYCSPFVEAAQSAPDDDLDKTIAAWLATPTAGLPPGQVDLCRSPKTVAFIRTFLPLWSALSEARNALGQIGKDSASAATDHLARGEAPFCPSGGAVPRELQAPGTKYAPKRSDWDGDPGWHCLDFSMDEPMWFQYWFDTAPTTFTASARALFVVHERPWKVTLAVSGNVKDGQVFATPEIEERWEMIR